MEKIGEIRFIKEAETGKNAIYAQYSYVGKETDKGYHLWYFPAIDTWFQTRTRDEAKDVSWALFDNFIDIFLREQKGPDAFIKKLKELGWTGLPQKKKVSKRGYRASDAYIPSDLVGASPNFSKGVPPIISHSFAIRESINRPLEYAM